MPQIAIDSHHAQRLSAGHRYLFANILGMPSRRNKPIKTAACPSFSLGRAWGSAGIGRLRDLIRVDRPL
jgi:hypothetical protein